MAAPPPVFLFSLQVPRPRRQHSASAKKGEANIFERFCFAFLLRTHTVAHTHCHTHINKNSFCGFYHAQTQAAPLRLRLSLPLNPNEPVEQTALIGVDGVIYINVCHFSSFAQFAFHFFGSLNCRRHVIYWPMAIALWIRALGSSSGPSFELAAWPCSACNSAFLPPFCLAESVLWVV